MKQWQWIVLFLITIIPFLFYFTTPTMIGADSYSYVDRACGLIPPVQNDILFDALNTLMPCNLFIMKLFEGILFLIFVFTFAKIGEIYDKDRGWWLGLISTTFTFIILDFFQYQNEPIAYTLFAVSLYFIILYDKTKTFKYLCLSLIIWIISGFFWKGSIYWGITLMIYAPLTAIVIIPVYIFFWAQFIWFLSADASVAFYQPLIGVIYLGMTLLLLFGLLKSSKKQVLSWAFSMPFLFWVQRLYQIAVPTSLIIAFNALCSLKVDKKTIEYTLIVFCFFMSIFWCMHILKEFPTFNDLELIQNLHEKTVTVQNSFGLGYLLINQGFSVSSYGWPHYPDYDYIGYVVLERGIEDKNCPVDSNSDNLFVLKC